MRPENFVISQDQVRTTQFAREWSANPVEPDNHFIEPECRIVGEPTRALMIRPNN